jgi:zinc protease
VPAGHESDSDVLDVVGRVLTERLQREVRENQGLTYSVQARSQPGDAYPQIGAFVISLTCDPRKVDAVAGTVQSIVDEFVKTGPTQQELQIATNQLAMEIRANQDSAFYWLLPLARAEYAHVNLGWLKNRVNAILSVNDPESVRKIAASYLTPQHRILVMSYPSIAHVSASPSNPKA